MHISCFDVNDKIIPFGLALWGPLFFEIVEPEVEIFFALLGDKKDNVQLCM